MISEWSEEELCRKDKPADSFTDKDSSQIAENDNADGERAFTFRKIPPKKFFGISNNEGLLKCTIEIESQPLLNLMNSCMKVKYDLKETLNSPFEWLVWSWDALQAKTNTQEDDSEDMKQARIDLHELLQIVSNRTGIEPLDAYFTKRSIYTAEKSITHQALWTIFQPGTTVCASIVFNEPQLFFVTDSTLSFPNPDKREKDFMITCSCLDWDGRRFKLIPCELKIEYFKEKRPISALSVFPLEYHKDAKGLEDLLIKRGRKYEEYCTAQKGKQMFRYHGPIISHKGGHVFQESVEIDFETTSHSSVRFEDHTSLGPSEVRSQSYLKIYPVHRFSRKIPRLMKSLI